MSKNRARLSRDLALIILFGGTIAGSLLVPPSAHAAVTGSIQGVVRGEDGKGLPSASVKLLGTGATPIAITDKNGYYTFTGVQPGPYTLEVTFASFEDARSPITVLQDQTAQVDFSMTPKIGETHSRVFVAPTRRTGTNTQTTITAKDEQREKSQPNTLYQYMGLLNYRPGVVMDAGQYPHLRGSDLNQIDYLIDGISVRDPVLNQFATNAITVGIQRSNIQTAGQDASYGGATGGYLNQTTANGRDLQGGYIENTNGPASMWSYEGGNFGYGNITPDGKLDYTVSSIVFKNKLANNTQIKELHSSDDFLGKVNYYLDGNNTFTLYGSHGAENYFYPDLPDPADQTLRLGTQTIQNPNGSGPVLTVTNTGKFQQDQSQQATDMTYFLAKHNFTQSSNLQYRLFKIHQNIAFHTENTRASDPFYRTQMVGNQLDYTNQFNRNFQMQMGVVYNNKDGSYQHNISSITGLVAQKANGYGDKLRSAAPKETDLYLTNKYTTSDDKVTLDLGVRYGSTAYDLQPSSQQGRTVTTSAGTTYKIDIPKSYTSAYADPRLGMAYSPAPDLTFRTSYSVNSQQPETVDIEYLNPLEYGGFATALNPDKQFISAHKSALPFNRLTAYHSNDFDLGVEKAFNLSGLLKGAYSTTLTGYQKKQYDLIEENQESFDAANFAPGAISYDNSGHGHASGVEFQLTKRQVGKSDWNGYLTYTNQVVRSSSSLFDTGNVPYFASALAGSPFFYDSHSDAQGGNPNGLPVGNDFRKLNQIEFPTSYDQRHTVAIVAGKRFSRLVESTFILDAGSGFPYFSGGTSSDSSDYSAADAQHGNLNASLGGNANFTEVPFVASGTNRLVPVNPIAGRTGWHYKISINTNFYITPTTSLFFNVDNIFDRKTALTLGPQSLSGLPYYQAPSAQYPQGKIVYGPQSVINPIFLTFGFRQSF